MTQNKILVVDDNKIIREAVDNIFSGEYEMSFAEDGFQALEKAEEFLPDLILLDVRMPKMDGFQTCLRLRQKESTKNTPIIFLTTTIETRSETFGLELGADDYVTIPFDKDVLRARVKKRLGQKSVSSPDLEATEIGDYVIHWDRYEATHGKEKIPLTTKEMGLLKLFYENRGRVLSRNIILENLWAETFITDRTVDSHVKELRKKIPPLVTLLKTVYGAGYRLDL